MFQPGSSPARTTENLGGMARQFGPISTSGSPVRPGVPFTGTASPIILPIPSTRSPIQPSVQTVMQRPSNQLPGLPPQGVGTQTPQFNQPRVGSIVPLPITPISPVSNMGGMTFGPVVPMTTPTPLARPPEPFNPTIPSMEGDTMERRTALSTLLYQYGKEVVDRLINLRLFDDNYLIQNITFVDNFNDMVARIGLEPAINIIVNGSQTVGQGTTLIEGKVKFHNVRVPVDNYGGPSRPLSRIGQVIPASTQEKRWESPSDPFILNNSSYLEPLQRTFIETTEPGRIKTSVKGGARCPNCQSDNTTVQLIQMRGADEPVTPFYTCKNCGRTWKG